jgi:hypothetical protein
VSTGGALDCGIAFGFPPLASRGIGDEPMAFEQALARVQ